MTKNRAPLTFELALTKVAGLIGWDRCAAITGKAANTLRNYSDPDTMSGITLDSALALDVAFQAAGGDGAPFHECYALRLELDMLIATGCSQRLARKTATAIKEAGEAHAALLMASRPGASDADRAIAEREAEEAAAALTSALAELRAGRGGGASPPGGTSE